jgi:hypothetical protein
VDVVLWAPVVSACVAVAAAIGSLVSWIRARGERATAAEQAKLAAESQAGASQALQKIATLQARQNEQQKVRASAAERDPWVLRRLSDTNTEAEIFNDTGTAKYVVGAKIYANDQLWEEKVIPFVGPKRSARIPYIDMSAEMRAVITWHLDEDASDEPASQTIEW